MTFFLRHFSTTYYVYYGVNRFKSIMMQENPYPIPASQTEHFVDLVKDPPPIVTEIKVCFTHCLKPIILWYDI